MEPLSKGLSGSEIESTEEALNKLTELNALVRRDRNYIEDPKNNMIHEIGSWGKCNNKSNNIGLVRTNVNLNDSEVQNDTD